MPASPSVELTDRRIRVLSLGAFWDGYTSSPKTYESALRRAIALVADVSVVPVDVGATLRHLPQPEADMRRSMLRGDFLSTPDDPKAVRRLHLNFGLLDTRPASRVVELSSILTAGVYVQSRGPLLEASVEFVRNPNAPWVTFDVPLAALSPHQCEAKYRSLVRLPRLERLWLVGVNGIPIVTFERIWSDLHARPSTVNPDLLHREAERRSEHSQGGRSVRSHQERR